MEASGWIWYPGDFERYHALRQNFSRVERGCGWPAFWKSEGFRHRVVFRRRYRLERETSFRVYSGAVGFVLAGERKYPFGQEVVCPPGDLSISIHAGRIDAFPSVYVQGEEVCSDEGWLVEDYALPPVRAGRCKYFTRPEQDPARWDYSEKLCLPVRTERCQGGTLYEFETELTAVLWLKCEAQRREPLRVYCGESREEALDTEHCYYSWTPDPVTGKCPRCAVRYAFIPGPEVSLAAIHQYVDLPVRACFTCDDTLLNRIWEVAAHTFRLCSGIFFLDGVKRDGWIWAGDAYQSLFVNRYLLADPEIEQRTLLALGESDPVTGHINTIVDYSLLWLLGVLEHCRSYGDLDFLRQLYPSMVSLMALCEGQTEEHGFLLPREQDWVFIDWAELDKEGPLGAEQMLLAACWRAMAQAAELLVLEGDAYLRKGEALARQINAHYWDEEQGAYVDSFTSGRGHVSRQTNLFALLFLGVEEGRQGRILKNVIHNQAVSPITTPYFQFYELELLSRLGELEAVWQRLHSYWGGMLERGAVTFWEDFDPGVEGCAQYDMYGDKFGKSLCHAWSASPIYFRSCYFVGLRYDALEGGGFHLSPHLSTFSHLRCTLPLGRGDHSVSLDWDGERLEVHTDHPWGGLLHLGEQTHPIPCGTSQWPRG